MICVREVRKLYYNCEKMVHQAFSSTCSLTFQILTSAFFSKIANALLSCGQLFLYFAFSQPGNTKRFKTLSRRRKPNIRRLFEKHLYLHTRTFYGILNSEEFLKYTHFYSFVSRTCLIPLEVLVCFSMGA